MEDGNFLSLSVSVTACSVVSSASGIAISLDPSSIMFTSTLTWVAFVIPAFMVLRHFIAAFATVILSLSESTIIYVSRPHIMNSICLSLC